MSRKLLLLCRHAVEQALHFGLQLAFGHTRVEHVVGFGRPAEDHLAGRFGRGAEVDRIALGDKLVLNLADEDGLRGGVRKVVARLSGAGAHAGGHVAFGVATFKGERTRGDAIVDRIAQDAGEFIGAGRAEGRSRGRIRTARSHRARSGKGHDVAVGDEPAVGKVAAPDGVVGAFARIGRHADGHRVGALRVEVGKRIGPIARAQAGNVGRIAVGTRNEGEQHMIAGVVVVDHVSVEVLATQIGRSHRRAGGVCELQGHRNPRARSGSGQSVRAYRRIV